MKLIKLFAASSAAMLLAACAQTAAPKAEKAEKAAAPTITDKTVVYQCGKQKVTATYQFENQEPTAAMVMIGNKVVAKDFVRDAAQKDFTAFTSGDYVLNVDSGLVLNRFNTTDLVNLTQKGKSADKILAKNCQISLKGTAKANR